ncbi:MAG: hypothetical protein AAFN78_06200 [Pseudomonadota bacterium]
MNPNVNEETLTLYYYDDGLSEEERASVRAALKADPQLGSRYTALCTELDALRVQAAYPAAPAGAVDRWQAALDEAAGRPAVRRRGSNGPALWLFPAAAALVLGIGIGLRMGDAPPGPDPTHQPTALAVAQDPLERGVAAYMQRSRVELAGLDVNNDDARASLIAELVVQNRLFERRAAASGDAELARVLRAFDQLLGTLADAPENGAALSAGRDQLSFEYAVMLTKLGHAPSDDSHSL